VTNPTPLPRGERTLGLNRFAILGLTLLLVPGLTGVASAQGLRPRLSEDLKDKLSAGDNAATRAILSATDATVDALVQRQDLRVIKRLKTGWVVEVPAGKLNQVANDGGVDQLSSDGVMRSQMAITNVTIGADILI